MEAIFFIYMDSYIVCLFCFVLFLCFVFVFLGRGVWQPQQLFTSFVLFLFSSTIFQLKVNRSCSNTQKNKPISKACHRHFNAKSNVHSMIELWRLVSISVFYRLCFFSAVRAFGRLSAVRPFSSKEARLYFTQTSELCLFLCNRTQREKVITDMRSYICTEKIYI